MTNKPFYKHNTLPSRMNELVYRKQQQKQHPPTTFQMRRSSICSNGFPQINENLYKAVSTGHFIGIDLNNKDPYFISDSRAHLKEQASQFTKHYKQYKKSDKQYKGKLSANVLKIMEQAQKDLKSRYPKRRKRKLKLDYL